MYREPYGRGCRIGPVDAMTAVRGDVEPIAGPQQARLGLVGKPQLGGAGKHQHPFALRLVVPEPRRARLTPKERTLIGPAEAPLNRATSSRNAGRNHLGTPSEIKSEWWATSSRICGRLPPESQFEAFGKLQAAFLAPGSFNCPATSRACSARSSHSKASFKIDGIWSSFPYSFLMRLSAVYWAMKVL